MANAEGRYARQAALFGDAGQQALERTATTVVGLGGLGAHAAQQLAYLGVTRFMLIDDDIVEHSNLNRLVGATAADIGSTKVDVAARMIASIHEAAAVTVHPMPVRSAPAAAFDHADIVFACVDDDAVRLEIIERCAAARCPSFDLATDTGDDWFGGRVLFSGEGERCASCMELLDQVALRRASMTAGQRAEDERIYGVPADALATTGPAVVSINGVIGSLAITEFMKWRTGMGEPAALLTYRGDRGIVTRSLDAPRPGCFYCGGWVR